MLARLHQIHVFRWPLVLYTVFVWDYVCVRARTGPRLPHPRALNSLTVSYVCVCIYSEASGCQVLCFLWSPLPFCVYRCEHDKVRLLDSDTPPHPPLSCFLPCEASWVYQTRRQKNTGWWNLRCSNEGLIRPISTPICCMFRWLRWINYVSVHIVLCQEWSEIRDCIYLDVLNFLTCFKLCVKCHPNPSLSWIPFLSCILVIMGTCH